MLDDRGIADRGGIHANDFALNVYAATRGDDPHLRIDGGEQMITPRFVGIANIELHAHAARNAVDRAGKYFADAAGADGIDRAGGSRQAFERQREFRRREECVVPVRHEDGAGVLPFALDDEPHRRRERRSPSRSPGEFRRVRAAAPARYAVRREGRVVAQRAAAYL